MSLAEVPSRPCPSRTLEGCVRGLLALDNACAVLASSTVISDPGAQAPSYVVSHRAVTCAIRATTPVDHVIKTWARHQVAGPRRWCRSGSPPTSPHSARQVRQ